jgi:UDP-N-acetylmuramate: L-alanyl-gamma-D-glutamyl-meso-diaminopimelate ligase
MVEVAVSEIAPPVEERLRRLPAAIRHVHLVAVGGVGMGALAGMLKQRGFRVTGSDEQLYPPMSEILERLGIEVRRGYAPEHLDDAPDLVVIGNKVSRTNAEAAAVLQRGLPYLSFPEALARFFIRGRRSLVVAGTHGKTTSTAMLAWVLEVAGRDPSLMVGGESLDFGGNFKLGSGEFFVVEGDEYDSAFFDKGPKFLHYQPGAVLLTAVEFDHADIFRDLDQVKDAFRRLVQLIPAGAPLVVASDFPHALDCVRDATAAVTTFGLAAGATWRATDLSDTGRFTRFTVRHREQITGVLDLPQPGAINARNALGVYVLARELGSRHAEIAAALARSAGVRRRQELVGEFFNVVLIDDFAHHPTAVAGTLAAIRLRYPERRLWALFEPRSNTSRRKIFQKEYREALAAADRVVVASVFRKDSDCVNATELFSPEQLVRELRDDGRVAYTAESAGAVERIVGGEVADGDVIVMMSNGDFGGLRDRLVAMLRRRPARVGGAARSPRD